MSIKLKFVDNERRNSIFSLQRHRQLRILHGAASNGVSMPHLELIESNIAEFIEIFQFLYSDHVFQFS